MLAHCLNMVYYIYIVFKCLKPSSILFPWTNILCFRHRGDDVDLIPLQEMKVGQLSCVRSGALPREVFNRIAARAGEQWTQNLVEKEGWKTTTPGIGTNYVFFYVFFCFLKIWDTLGKWWMVFTCMWQKSGMEKIQQSKWLSDGVQVAQWWSLFRFTQWHSKLH